MGDFRQVNGVWEHNDAGPGLPPKWARYGYDDFNNPRRIFHSDTLAITASPEDGNTVFDFGGELLSTTPETAATINDHLVAVTLAGKGVQVADQVAQLQTQVDAKQAELATVTAELDAKLTPPDGLPVAAVVP